MATIRRSWGFRAILMTLAVFGVASTWLDTQSAGAESGATRITVTPRPDANQSAPCLTTPWALRNVVGSDESSFTLRVVTTARLCVPVEATAVVYSMPGNGQAWPQKLVETVPVTIGPAGSIDIVFHKACDPQQFDVVTGATPETIAPFGPWHGPLLFPLDTSTAQQFWGPERGSNLDYEHSCHGPRPVVPEAPVAILLPMAAILVGGGITLGRRRSQRRQSRIRSAQPIQS